MCELSKDRESYYGNLDSNPPLEIRVSLGYFIRGFSAKFDNGNIGVWGMDASVLDTDWVELVGPVIGFHF